MLKIKYKTLSSGPNGTIYSGSILTVSDKEGKELIDGGYAELIEEIKEEHKTVKKKLGDK